ncbi:MAG: radical SAM protein [Bacteroidales bacterium]|nr:radical SAM protein [Bacteroidales bacterium]
MILYEAYHHCTLCPHECGANRNNGEIGVCGASAQQHIASICIHRGEEPAISGKNGICNVFFSYCNLSCVYCQNHQISRHISPLEEIMTTEAVVKQIIAFLDKGIRAVGFVSPSHMAIQVIDIIEQLWHLGYKPVTIWNSNAYDKVETLRMLEAYIDVYLPDFKYSDDGLALRYSKIKNYTQTAILAIKEMYYQKGNTLVLNNNGEIERGLIIRHLVLPHHTENSLNILDLIANELSPRIAISLMAQYYPPHDLTLPKELQGKLTKAAYQQVVDYAQELGINKGWIQEFESADFYQPDFHKSHPFEHNN